MTHETAIESTGVLVTRPVSGVVEVRLNRPEKLNALDEDMYRALTRVFSEMQEDGDVRAVILSGEGRGFCSGSDVGAMRKTEGRAGRTRLQRRHNAVQAVYRLEKPVIAAVQGPVSGIGFALAMACDMIIATDNAYFQQSFHNVGLVPDGGSIFFLGQRLGVGRAKELVMTGRRLGACEARDWGVVNRVVAEDDLRAASLALATEFAAAPTYIIGLTKKMFAAGCSPSLETILEIESYAAGVARASEDHKEGVAAFKEKRKPGFTGR